MLGGWPTAAAPSLFNEEMSVHGVLSWDAVPNAYEYKVFAFEKGAEFDVEFPNHRDVWAGAFINNAPTDSGSFGLPDRTQLSLHTPPTTLTIEDFHITSNTTVMQYLAVDYVILPATITELDVRTMDLDPGVYQFRIQAIAPEFTGEPVTIAPNAANIGILPWSNSRVSGAFHWPGPPFRGNIVYYVDFPEFTITDGDRLATPTNLRFVDIPTDGVGGGSGPHTNNGHRAIEWDHVPGAYEYIIYAFENATATHPIAAYRSQVILAPEAPNYPRFNIGHEGVQARNRFNPYPNTTAGQIGAPTNADGELAFHAMMASSRQSFDLPLPYRAFYFRVVALPPATGAFSEYAISDPSAPLRATPGARSLDAAQMGALVDDAIERGAGGLGFIQIETGTQAINNAGTMGVLFVPLSNQPAPSYDYFNSYLDGETNSVFLSRIAFEIQHHPAYIGPETLIFTT